jgi:hypothetical protein
MNRTLSLPIYLFILIGSVSITLWSVYADPIINVDGILYINTAKALAAGTTEHVNELYKWPVYSHLIAFMHKVTGLDLIAAAHVINAIFNVAACIVFVHLVAMLGGTRRTVLIASLVIVLFPGLNELRSYIIRDHGFIAFYLSSFLFLLRALHHRGPGLLLASMALMGCATLFRIEGVVFLAAVPFIYYYSGDRSLTEKRVSVAIVCLLVALFVVPVLGWWLHDPERDAGSGMFSAANYEGVWTQISNQLHVKMALLKDRFLETSSGNTARLTYIWTVLGVILIQIMITLSVPYSVIAGYGLKKRLAFPHRKFIRPWKLFIYFNVLVLLLFTFILFILTDRYSLALVLLLLMIVPFALEHIYEKWRQADSRSWRTRTGYGLLALVLVANCIEGFTSLAYKEHLKESGAWLHSRVSPGDRLYTNNRIVLFYSGIPKDKVTVVNNMETLFADLYSGEWINHDFLVLQIPPDPKLEPHLKATLWVKPEKVFTNKKGDQVRFYDIAAYRKSEQQRESGK